ncbi:PLP-dependent aminotransferase family protein [Ignatzschineria rhizosphaerae]|uniref:PLP-dependent aminotransferase family protein n=1 Tax=Ignatzschineria rhizosphaerae TaxID=2923279 RepID=A0ABY3X1B2_9GAMM|nr:PLP-dependent aminotransferase family protein [Ignatzschineria rhizosphaerae]UNM95556.1 PLP-dependent aminotransferase family protein [Ignatzschineria rhizosphaerae]
MRQKAIFPELQLQEGRLNEQVYHAIHQAILSGKLPAGTKIPSSRHLSEMMHVSRNTILQGIEQLIDEGYLETRRGSGTYVVPYAIQALPDQLITNAQNIPPSAKPVEAPQISDAISQLQSGWKSYQNRQKPFMVFKVGVGCTDLFPQTTWSRLLGRISRHSHKEITCYNDVMGYLPLREALANYLTATRGVQTTADHIMIVNGTQQAINLAIQVLLNPYDEVILDDPGYDGALGAFLSRHIKVNRVKGDEEGTDIPFAEKHYPKSKLIYSTPSHQFPLGTTMSLSRRLQLLEWANAGNRWIFEDDYNGEFRYRSRSIQALQGLDHMNRVIYSGTFSKMFYPGFRLGFLALPTALIEPFKIAKYYADACNSFLEQAVLAAFIKEGEYAKHVRRIRRACLERKNTLRSSVQEHFADDLIIPPTDSGIHSVAWLKNSEDLPYLLEACQTLNLGPQSLDRHRSKPLSQKALLFGFAAHSPEIITDNIQNLAKLFYALKKSH